MYENQPVGGPGSGRGIFMSGFANFDTEAKGNTEMAR